MALILEEVLAYLNNYFVDGFAPNIYVTFTAVDKKITLSTEDETLDNIGVELEAAQYLRIEGSKLNDGIFKVDSVGTNYIVVEETLIDEEADYINLYELAIPQKLLSLVTEMIAWSGTNNVKSERLGPHSITYDKPVTVFTSFESRLKRWRKVGFR
ncbi:hypothetical protein KAX02_00640 [candidate division WOR-3 bacterium]|nr:hypothetical protein [candidate division WOR-3 bacterium]